MATPARLRRAAPISTRRIAWEIALTALMIGVTLAACALFARDTLRLGDAAGEGEDRVRLLAFVAVVGLLVYGNLVYQVARLGYLLRRLRHHPPAFEDLVASRWEAAPPVAVLVPSYKEDLRTIRQTLLSAALQHYPNRRVVLLLDDPPHPADREDAARLAAARRVPAEVEALLRVPAARVERGAAAFADRVRRGVVDPRGDLRALLEVYSDLTTWFARLADQVDGAPRADHTDAFFADATVRAHRRLLWQSARRLTRELVLGGLGAEAIAREYRRLGDLFRVEVTAFERKRYANLAHEPNKAANLNSYMGLLGRRARETRGADGLHLVPRPPGEYGAGDLVVPDATYVLTLDADSLLTPDYTLRLVDILERPGNERLAVVQTPYTAVPGPSGTLERIAGATTDMQYVVHQGFTWCGATFWVGANALLRKVALDDIRTEEVERGHRVDRFIQDRTVIEDTESTVDLIARGWRLHNYPERLAHSATPPDFGSLLIQRRRWANGGLLILPKLLRYAWRGPRHRATPLELLMRLHYLGSLFAGSVGLLALLFLPLEEGFGSVWLPVTAAPYFLLYGRDLLQAGYRRGDLLRVYAFNMLLLPVHLAGVAKSLQQAVTGAKTPFGRTPKVEGRTAAPAWAVLAEYLLLAYCLTAAGWDALAGRWLHALFSLGTAAALAYAVVAFVGTRASWEDLRAGWRGLGLGVPEPARRLWASDGARD